MDLILPTPLHYLGEEVENKIYIKRDDMTGFAFGGNKARKNRYFIEEALKKEANHIITYGSVDSNHCRIVAAYAKKYKKKCTLILAETSNKKEKGNFSLYRFFEAKIKWTQVDKVKETIDDTIKKIQIQNEKPYFIYGGAHGNLGTQAYVDAFKEIIEIDKFDYIFLASGTGTTQAGLIAGNSIFNEDKCKIVGISIARKEENGKNIIKNSLKEYCIEKNIEISSEIYFSDKYIGSSYGDIYTEVKKTIKDVAFKYNIILDPIYTGKAFYGMKEYLKENKIKNKKILFLHTGGLPLFFKYQDIIIGE